MPRPGERVSGFSAADPSQLMERMASGSVAAKQGVQSSITMSVRLRTLRKSAMRPLRVFTFMPQKQLTMRVRGGKIPGGSLSCASAWTSKNCLGMISENPATST